MTLSPQVTRAVPRHDDPVLGAVVVHLQRQLRARLDHDALDLEALARVDAVVAAPRPVDLACGAGARCAPAPSAASTTFLTLLHLVLVRDQHRVGGLDHDQVVRRRPARPCGSRRAPACCGTSSHDRRRRAWTLPSASLGCTSASADHEPTSLQPMSTGTTDARRAVCLHHRVVDRIATGRPRTRPRPGGRSRGRGRRAGHGGSAALRRCRGAKLLEFLQVARRRGTGTCRCSSSSRRRRGSSRPSPRRASRRSARRVAAVDAGTGRRGGCSRSRFPARSARCRR